MKHTLSTAARATNVSRSTIHRAIQSGKLSASKNEEGEYRIDPAELHRVYPAVPQHPKRDDLGRSETPNDTGSEMAVDLLEMVREKDTQLADTQAELDDTKKRLNEHREAARALIDPQTFEAKQHEWQQALADRQLEITKARADAETLRQQQAEQAESLEKERKRVKALQSRGLIARMLNKPITENG